ncbi:hypothetical protein R5W23_003707 [Gemmata sp. JC673]|uniref:Uncharacterized protein n=1 Tax=Gemmata algarum TaxID=2975278 RepID=A0ABU5F674_9BACT|nr:hypothetical protein [Gemmata algarum]MDY3562245.1 hypothetical protein [Gemmata algarum]
MDRNSAWRGVCKGTGFMTDYEKLSLQLLSQILAGISVSIQLHQRSDGRGAQTGTMISDFYSAQLSLLAKVSDAIKRHNPIT